jgi:hypothetical protein
MRQNREQQGGIGMNAQMMTIIVTAVCAVLAVGQILLIKVANEKGWSIRIRPLNILACIIVVVLGVYSLVTGNYLLK